MANKGSNSTEPKGDEPCNGTKDTTSINNHPNQAIVIVGTIQGLSDAISRQLEGLVKFALSTEQNQAVTDAKDDTDVFQRLTIAKMRKVFG